MTSQTYDRLGSLSERELDALQGSDDALVAGDLALLDWHVEVNAGGD